MKGFFVFLGFVFCSLAFSQTTLAQTVLNQPLSQGFFGLDSQTVSGEQKIYTINLPENASWLFVGVLAMEGDMYLEVKNSSNDVFLGSGGSVAVEDARQGTYTVTVSGNGKYLVFWDYLSSLRVQDCSSTGGICTQNPCNTYINCNSLPAGACKEGICCTGSCGNPVPPGAMSLPWELRNYHVGAGPPGSKTTFVISVEPGITYGTVGFYCLLPDCEFNFKFTPVPGYLYFGHSPYTGYIQYGYLNLMFTASSYSPKTADGDVPPGNYIFEIEWLSSDPSRAAIKISSSKY